MCWLWAKYIWYLRFLLEKIRIYQNHQNFENNSKIVYSIKHKQCLSINETIFGISYDWYVSKIHSMWNDLLLEKYIYKNLVVKQHKDVGREIIEFDFYFIVLHLLTDIIFWYVIWIAHFLLFLSTKAVLIF